MSNFQIRAFGQMGASLALGVTIGNFEIMDKDTGEIALYDCLTVDAGKSPAVSMTVLSSWSDLPSSGLRLEDYYGGISVGQASAGAIGGRTASPSVMGWLSGPAQGTQIDTSGWVIGTPAISASAGYLKFREKMMPRARAWEIRDATLSIWFPNPNYQTFQRPNHYNDWAGHWGDVDLRMEDNSGLTYAGKGWDWAWTPDINRAYDKKLPVPLFSPDHGKGWLVFDPDGVLKSGGAEFAYLRGMGTILNNPTPRPNRLYYLPQDLDSNGHMTVRGHRFDILWMLTRLDLPRG